MKPKKKILILDAGGGSAVLSLKLLRKHKSLYLIAADMDPYAPGLYLADKSLVIPPASSPKFTKTIKEIIRDYKIDLILPCFEYGFKKLRSLRGNFINDFEAAIRCQDKFLFSLGCERVGLPVPKTELLGESTSPKVFPKYIKPRVGSGAKNHYVADSQRKLDSIKKLIKDRGEFIIQDFLTGKHWAADVLVEKGKPIKVVTRRDIRQRGGECVVVEVRDYPKLIKFAEKVQKAFDVQSIFNLEVFEVKPQKFVINEINVRFGSGMIFDALAGCDFVSYLATGEKKYLGKIKPAIYARYYEEIVINPKQVIRHC